MSDKDQDYWKELMGEDFKADLDAVTPKAPPEAPAPQENPAPQDTSATPGAPEAPVPEPFIEDASGVEPGFTIEYVSRQDQNNVPPPVPPVQRQRPAQPYSPPPERAGEGYARNPAPPAQPRPARQSPAPNQGAPRTEGAVTRGKKRGVNPDNFEVEFDFDSEYADVDEKAVRRGRTKRTGCLSGILMFLFVVCVSAVLAAVGWIWATDVLGLDGDDMPVEITLPREYFHTEERTQENDDGEEETTQVQIADIDKVAEDLYQKGLIRYKWLFKLFSKISSADEKIKPGTYTLNMNYDYRAIVHGMSAKSVSRDSTKVTIPEGYTITQIVDLLVDSGVCERQELLDTLKDHDFDYDFLKDGDVPPLGDPKRLEGYLFPDTYEFYIGDDPVNVIRKFLNNFENKWQEDFDNLAEEQGYSRRDILIIASMIEKEAGNDSERDIIASVIYNRLRHPGRQGTNGLLQINATIYYVTADTGEDYSTEIDSPYNTYLYPGLPAGPIANPGISSIRAALQPQETDYYYYALGTNKAHKFFETYEGFTNFVNSDQYGGSKP